MAAIKIAVKNVSTVVADIDVKNALPDFQKQVHEDFAQSEWGIDADLSWAERDAPIGDAWLLVVLDNADQAGALGYHDLTNNGQPIGKVFARTTKEYGGNWTVTFSHEMLEMIADPNINLCAFDENARRLYAYEVCDAVEDDNLAYQKGKTMVSDFVLPGWFEPLHALKGESFAFKSKVPGPFQLLPGGYIGYFDLNGDGWQQLTADAERMDARNMDPRSMRAVTATHGMGVRANVGSRRERRRTLKSSWQRSTRD
jgi:hypothetical protein